MKVDPRAPKPLRQHFDYADMLRARGTPGSTVAADGREHRNGYGESVPCPDGEARYLTADGHMWLPLRPPLDQRETGKILEIAFGRKVRE